jgi:hypothetical protein
VISFSIPIKTQSVANVREHWTAKAKRTKSQRDAAMKLCPKWTHGPLLVVTLTRTAPRELDSDNLASALKATRDGIAARLRIDDGSPLVDWRYQQRKGEPGVLVEIRAKEHVK